MWIKFDIERKFKMHQLFRKTRINKKIKIGGKQRQYKKVNLKSNGVHNTGKN